MRESGQQPLGKGVDGVDPQPPARAIEHLREQGAGARHLRLVGFAAEKPGQVVAQIGLGAIRPLAEMLGDASKALVERAISEARSAARAIVQPPSTIPASFR